MWSMTSSSMTRMHGLIIQLPAFQGAGPGVGHQHVTDAEKLVQYLPAIGTTQVERDALLVAAHAFPDQAHPVATSAPGAQRVPGSGLLDLYHLGAELTERGGDKWPCGQRRGVDHP